MSPRTHLLHATRRACFGAAVVLALPALAAFVVVVVVDSLIPECSRG